VIRKFIVDAGTYKLCTFKVFFLNNELCLCLIYRKDCFTSEYFEGCLAVLQITDKKDKIMEDLSIIHRQMESRKEN
jgi:hypothetical protein